MTEEQLLALPFENIKESSFFGNRPVIFFEINGFRYEIITSQKKDGSFDIAPPRHGTPNTPCPICKETRTLYDNFCSELKPYQDQVFEKLINEPKIRLLWLFRER